VSGRRRSPPAVTGPTSEEALFFIDAWRWAQSGECDCFACWVLREKMGRIQPGLMEEWKQWKKKK